MFGLSELALIGGVGYFVVGPNELPRVARNVGYMLGQLFRVARSGQGVVSQFVKQNKLDELQKDFSEGVAELHALRSELQNEARKASPSYQIRNALTHHAANPGGLSYDSISRSQGQTVEPQTSNEYIRANGVEQMTTTSTTLQGKTRTSGAATSATTTLGIRPDSAASNEANNTTARYSTGGSQGKLSAAALADDRAANMRIIQQHMVQAKLNPNTSTDTVAGGADILGDVLFERALARHQALEDGKD